MAWELPTLDLPLEAGEDLTTKQFYAVSLASANTVELADGTTVALGILQNKPNVGEAASVRVLGVSKAVAGGAIAAGAVLTAYTDGSVVAAGSGDYPLGLALESASAAGEIIAIFVNPTLVVKA